MVFDLRCIALAYSNAFQIAGYATWVFGWMLESIADGHKLAWSATPKSKRTAAFCNVGLWKYSRHPNYFGEWVAWNGLALAAIHPMLRFGGGERWFFLLCC